MEVSVIERHPSSGYLAWFSESYNMHLGSIRGARARPGWLERSQRTHDVVSEQHEMTESDRNNNAISRVYPGIPDVPNYSRPTDHMLGASAPSTTQQY